MQVLVYTSRISPWDSLPPFIVRKQLLSITLLSTQDGGRHSRQACLQRLFLASMHVSVIRVPLSLRYVGFTGVMRWSVGQYSGSNRAV